MQRTSPNDALNRHARRAAAARRRRARIRLGTTAAGLLVPVGIGLARADTYDEAIDGDLPGDFASRVIVAREIDFLTGTAGGSDQDQWSFEGIAEGTAYDVFFEVLPGGVQYSPRRLDGAGATAEQLTAFPGEGVSFVGTVGEGGALNFNACCVEIGTNGWSATLTLTAPEASYDEAIDGDLEDAFATREILGAGIDRIDGSLLQGDRDSFALTGVPANANFVLELDLPESNATRYRWVDTTGSPIRSAQVASNSSGNQTIGGTTPANGMIDLDLSPGEGGEPAWGITLRLGDDTMAVDEMGDFGDDFASREILAPGVNTVSGTLNAASDPDDYFSFTGLTGGATAYLVLDPPGEGTATLSALDAAGSATASVNSNLFEQRLLTTPVPANGQLDLRVQGEGSTAMTLDVTLVVPEPGAGLAGAAALGALAAMRPRRRCPER